MEMAGEMGQDRSEPLPHPAALVRMVRDLVAMGISLGTSRKLAAFCSSSMATKSQSYGSLLERAAQSGAPHFPRQMQPSRIQSLHIRAGGAFPDASRTEMA